MSKPRPDAKLLTLPPEAQAQIVELMLRGTSYHALLPIIAKEFGVKTSLGALSNFYQKVGAATLLASRKRAVQTADAVATDTRKHPGLFDEATIARLKQAAFELSINPGADPEAVKAIFSLVLKSREQDLTERKVKLLEKKAAQADATEQVLTDAQLSAEQRAQRIKEIYGRA